MVHNSKTMGEALYRKYRPKSFDDVVGQDHVITTLKNAIKSGRISHGYLLSGPKGVGKTSVARIIAYTLNDFDYKNSSGSLDIIEIDAASNRRIDEIRELRDKVNIAPSIGKYKVYIIDEVHMLTKEAFNALLKTLEEPPEHAVFILATTEAHKLPPTIISRTQHFTFKLVPSSEASNHLKAIAKNENIEISDEALDLIAHHGQGSFRDSISLLDQASNQDKIAADDIRQLVGEPPASLATQILEYCSSGDLQNLMEVINNYRSHGHNPSKIASQLLANQRDNIQNLNASEAKESLKLMSDLVNVPASFDPEQALEIALITYTLNKQPTKEKPTKTAESKPEQPSEQKPEPTPKKPEVTEKQEPKKSQKPVKADSAPIWEQVLAKLKGKQNTLYGIARMAEASVDGDVLRLTVPYEFHKKRLLEKRNKSLISAFIQEITGKDVKIDISVKAKDAPVVKQEEVSVQPLDVVSKIFGGGEVLES